MIIEGIRPIHGDKDNVEVILPNGEIHICPIDNIHYNEKTKRYYTRTIAKKSRIVALNRKERRQKICGRCGQEFVWDKNKEFKKCDCGVHYAGVNKHAVIPDEMCRM